MADPSQPPPTPDYDPGIESLRLDSSTPHRAPDFDTECVHYAGFLKTIEEITSQVEEVPLSSDRKEVIAHPNRYFTRAKCKDFFIFSQEQDKGAPCYPVDTADELLDYRDERCCQKLWIFGREPRNALKIDQRGVHYIGQDMYLGPDVGQAEVKEWKQLENLNEIASKIIGFVSGDNHTVAYTDTEVYFWGRFNDEPINSRVIQTGVPLYDGAIRERSLEYGDKYIKAVCGKNQTLLLTKNGKVYEHVQYSASNQPQPHRSSPEPSTTSSHVGLLSDRVSGTRVEYPICRSLKFMEVDVSKSRVIDVACTENACFIIIAYTDPSGERTHSGTVFGWSKWSETLFAFPVGPDMPMELYFHGNLNKDIVKIAATATYVLALNAEQELYVLNTDPDRIYINVDLNAPFIVKPGIGVLNIAAVYNLEAAVVLMADGKICQIYPDFVPEEINDVVKNIPVISNNFPKERRFMLRVKDTEFRSMMGAFMNMADQDRTRPYQTITFRKNENPPSGDPGDKVLKRTRESPKDTTVKRQKSNEETSD